MNKHQWEAEQVIEPPMALRLIQEQFPKLNAKHIRYLSAGWDNTAFIIDEELISLGRSQHYARRAPLTKSDGERAYSLIKKFLNIRSGQRGALDDRSPVD